MARNPGVSHSRLMCELGRAAFTSTGPSPSVQKAMLTPSRVRVYRMGGSIGAFYRESGPTAMAGSRAPKPVRREYRRCRCTAGMMYPVPFATVDDVVRLAVEAEQLGYYDVAGRSSEHAGLRPRAIAHAARLLRASDHAREHRGQDLRRAADDRHPGAPDA